MSSDDVALFSEIQATDDLTKLDERDELELMSTQDGHDSDTDHKLAITSPVAATTATTPIIDLSKADDKNTSSLTVTVEALKPEVTSIKTTPTAIQKSSESRHSQKTRSFSAGEETPEKKISTSKSKELKEFPFKDVAHSRSEQLAIQQQSGAEDDASVRSKMKTSISAKGESAVASKSGGTKVSVVSGDALARQYDYHDQPMSLQYDMTSVKISDESRTCSDVRKSGRDLTELGMENMRDRKSGRPNQSNSRPRLECFPYNL